MSSSLGGGHTSRESGEVGRRNGIGIDGGERGRRTEARWLTDAAFEQLENTGRGVGQGLSFLTAIIAGRMTVSLSCSFLHLVLRIRRREKSEETTLRAGATRAYVST